LSLTSWRRRQQVRGEVTGKLPTSRVVSCRCNGNWAKADVSLQRLSSWRQWERTVCYSVGSSVQPSYRQTVLHISAGQGSVNQHNLGQTSVICLQ